MGPGSAEEAVAERTLTEVYLGVIRFARHRAVEGDPVALGFATGLTSVARPAPSHQMVVSWLANCAGERRLIRPSADPEIATRLLSHMAAAEGRLPGRAQGVWREVVEGARTGRLAV